MKNRKVILRCLIGYIIGCCLVLIPDVRFALTEWAGINDGRPIIFVVITLFFIAPEGTVGEATFNTIWYCLAVVMAAFIDYFVLPYAISSPVLSMLYIILGILVLSTLKIVLFRSRKDRFVNTAILAMSLDLFNSYYTYKTTNVFPSQWVVVRMIFFLLGGLLSWLCAVLIYPTWAGDLLRKHLKVGLRQIGELFALIIDVLISEQEYQSSTKEKTLKQISQMKGLVVECRQTFSLITSAMRKSKWEISYSFFDREYYESFTVMIQRILKHLSTLSSACEKWVMKEYQEDDATGADNKHHLKQREYLKSFLKEIEPELFDMVDLVMNELKVIYKLFQKYNWKETQQKSCNLNTACFNFSTLQKKLEKMEKRFPERRQSAPNSPKSPNLNLALPFPSSHHQLMFQSSSVIPNLNNFSTSLEHHTHQSKKIYQDVMKRFYERQSDVLLDLCKSFIFKGEKEKKPDIRMQDTYKPIPDIQGMIIKNDNTLNNSETDMEDILSVHFLILGLGTFAEQIENMGKKSRSIKDKKKKLYIPYILNNTNGTKVKRAENDLELGLRIKDDPKENHDAVSSFVSVMSGVAFAPENRFTSTPLDSSNTVGLRNLLGKYFKHLKTPEHRFIIRVCILCSLLTLICVLPQTFQFFYDWKMRWSIMTVVLVCSPTVGMSLFIGFYRLIGTILGGALAALLGTLLQDGGNAPGLMVATSLVGLLLYTLFYSFPKYNRGYYFFLLSYTSVLLNGILEEDILPTSFEPTWLWAVKRTVSNSLGIAMGTIGTLLLFPFFSRTALRHETANITSNIGALFSKVMYALLCDQHFLKPLIHSFVKLEFEIEHKLEYCNNLLVAAKTEPSFSVLNEKAFKNILTSYRRMLDRMHGMRLFVFQGFSSEFRTNILLQLHQERKRMVGTVILQLHVFHGCISSKHPIPPALPDLTKSLQEINKKFESLPYDSLSLMAHDPHYLYIYFSVTEMIQELENLKIAVQDLCGTQDHEFVKFDEAYERALYVEFLEKKWRPAQ